MLNKKEKKVDVIDDGRTISDMNVDGFSWYQSKKTMKKKRKLMDLNLLPKERWAIIKGAYLAYLPVFLFIIGALLITYVLFYIWAVTR
ncbi:hypothetical protein RJI07_08340 [Mycoplasmatota bacterium WC30]